MKKKKKYEFNPFNFEFMVEYACICIFLLAWTYVWFCISVSLHDKKIVAVLHTYQLSQVNDSRLQGILVCLFFYLHRDVD